MTHVPLVPAEALPLLCIFIEAYISPSSIKDVEMVALALCETFPGLESTVDPELGIR